MVVVMDFEEFQILICTFYNGVDYMNTANLTVRRLDESFSLISGPLELLNSIQDYLKVERAGAFFDPLVKAGFKSKFDYFTTIKNEKLLVMNGHLNLLGNFNISPHDFTQEFSNQELERFLNEMCEILPFEPYDFQKNAFIECIKSGKLLVKACTGSGKSVIISLICEFFRRKGKKGLLIVPNINLLTQFRNDIGSYNLGELYENTRLIGGGETERKFDKSLTISTWQSLAGYQDKLHEIDYIIADEAHKSSADVFKDIINNSQNCKYKLGLTGTIPDDLCAKMQVVGLFGLPRTFITTKQLIDRKLATPIKINSLILNYTKEDKREFNLQKTYPKQMIFVKEHEPRTKFVVKLMSKLKSTGNTLGLYQHTIHGKLLFTEIMKSLHPEVEVLNKHITGKKSFEFQRKHGVYFLNGEDDKLTRERTRKILEEDLFKITLENGDIVRLHSDEKVLLSNGDEITAGELTEDSDICDEWLKNRR